MNGHILDARKRAIPEELKAKEKELVDEIDTVNKMTSELKKTQATADSQRQNLQRQQKSFSIFGAGFTIKRETHEIAQEIWRGMSDPMRISVTMTLKRIKELEIALNLKAQRTSAVEMANRFNAEADRARDWYRKIDGASNSHDGISRGRFMTMMADALPETGEMRDHFVDQMDGVKKGNQKGWEEKIFQQDMKPVTGSSSSSSKSDKSKQGGYKFPFKNKAEYVAAGGNSEKPAFPRPKHLHSYMKMWCRKCCYSTHESRACWELHGKPKGSGGHSGRERSRSRDRDNRTHRVEEPRRGDDRRYDNKQPKQFRR